MVLLTSSAISVAISSTVVCAFTFLLFLSGYVLQQQTVRSLQEALRRPPEPRPSITLPRQFWQEEEADVQTEQNDSDQLIQITGGHLQDTEAGTQEILGLDQATPSVQGLADVDHDDTGSSAGESTDIAVSTIIAPAATAKPEPRLAYILAISTPPQICSALLFFKWQREFGLQTPSLVLLYPSPWESDSSKPAYQAALDLMRNAQDSNNVVLRPVEISPVWEGITIENQLLAALQRNWMRWGIDRSIYLRSPGLALDVSKLDSALSKSSLKKAWTPLSSSPQDNPSVMLMSAERSMIMVPRGGMRGLTADAKTGNHDQHHSKEMEVEARLASKQAGYVVFDEKELEHRRGEKEWYGGVFERFERGQREVCAGTIFGDGTGQGMRNGRRM